MARMRIALSLDVPPGAKRDDVLAYVVDAVSSWKGSLRPPGAYSDSDPGDPMFGLDRESVSATYVKTRGNLRRIVRCEAE